MFATSRRGRQAGAAASVALTVTLLLGCVLAQDGWIDGRATWFDVGPDMSTANCHYSYAPTGRNVGAWSDAVPGFDSSCGRCYEVKCRPADFADGYGETLPRKNACYDLDKSVVITIVDACPCRYPNNAHSNARWCCGDMNHVDISREAFEQLADLGTGVIALSYREVDCSAAGNAGSGQTYKAPNTESQGSGSDSGSGSGSSSSGGDVQGSTTSAGWVGGWGSRSARPATNSAASTPAKGSSGSSGSSGGWRGWLGGRWGN